MKWVVLMSNMVVDLRAARQAYETGDWVQATRLFTSIIQHEPHNVEALHQFGRLCHEAGRHHEAVDLFRRALDEGPGRGTSQCRLSLVAALIAENKLPDALAECEQARDELPHETVDLLILQSNIFERLGDLESATRCLEDATSSRFPPSTEAMLALAELHHHQHNDDLASELFERVLQLEPRNSAALLRLTQMMFAEQVDVGDAWVERIQLAIPYAEDGRLRVELRFALARIHELRGQRTGASAAYRLANQDQANQWCQQGYGFELEPFERLVAEICHHVDRQVITDLPSCGDPSNKPIFLVGGPGSGQAEVVSRLTQSSGIEFWEAAPTFDRVATKLVGEAGALFPSCLANVGQDMLKRLARDYLAHLDDFAPNAEQVINAQPINSLYVGLIAVLFPNAQIVPCVRQPDEAARVAFHQPRPFDRIAPPDLRTLIRAQQAIATVMQHWAEVLPRGWLSRQAIG